MSSYEVKEAKSTYKKGGSTKTYSGGPDLGEVQQWLHGLIREETTLNPGQRNEFTGKVTGLIRNLREQASEKAREASRHVAEGSEKPEFKEETKKIEDVEFTLRKKDGGVEVSGSTTISSGHGGIEPATSIFIVVVIFVLFLIL